MVGIDRFWRDMGYLAGGLLAGLAADAVGYGGAIATVAGLTAASGRWVAIDLAEEPRTPMGRPEAAEAQPPVATFATNVRGQPRL